MNLIKQLKTIWNNLLDLKKEENPFLKLGNFIHDDKIFKDGLPKRFCINFETDGKNITSLRIYERKLKKKEVDGVLGCGLRSRLFPTNEDRI